MICNLSQHPSHEMVGKNDVLTLTPIASISSNSNSHSKTYNGNGSFPTKTTSKSFDTVPTPIIQNRYYKHQEEIEVEGGIVIAEDGLLDGSPRRKIQAVACYDGIRPTAAPSSSSSLSSSLAPAPDPSLNPRCSSRSAAKKNTPSPVGGGKGATSLLRGSLEEAWGRKKIHLEDVSTSLSECDIMNVSTDYHQCGAHSSSGAGIVSSVSTDPIIADNKILSRKRSHKQTESTKDIKIVNPRISSMSCKGVTAQTIGIANVTAGRRKLRVTMKSLVDIFQPASNINCNRK